MTATYAPHERQVRLAHSSPLDTLVRRTSSKRQAFQQQGEHQPRTQAVSSSSVPYSSRSPDFPSLLISPPKPPYYASATVPDSPLLHSKFRNSTSSNATGHYLNSESFLSLTDESNDPGYYDELDAYYEEDHVSVYSQSHGPGASSHNTDWDNAGPGNVNGFRSQNLQSSQSPPHNMRLLKAKTPTSPVPTVVVSTPQDVDKQVVNQPIPGRTPIVDPAPRMNFSRPGRPPIFSSEEQKRRVLERNSRRPHSPHTAQTAVSHPPIMPQTGIFPDDKFLSPTLQSNTTEATLSRSYLQPHHAASSPALTSPSHVQLPSRPPSLRPTSPASLYSTSYSFYHLSDSSPSPTGNSCFPSHSPSPPGNSSLSTEPSTANEYLQLGIQYHEADKLQDSAICFEKSAREEGGCGVGMLMWGLTLRHGWGCEKNEKSGFKWLTKAAESAVDDLGKAREGMDVKAVRVSAICGTADRSTDIFFISRSLCWRFTRSVSASSTAGVWLRTTRWR